MFRLGRVWWALLFFVATGCGAQSASEGGLLPQGQVDRVAISVGNQLPRQSLKALLARLGLRTQETGSSAAFSTGSVGCTTGSTSVPLCENADGITWVDITRCDTPLEGGATFRFSNCRMGDLILDGASRAVRFKFGPTEAGPGNDLCSELPFLLFEEFPNLSVTASDSPALSLAIEFQLEGIYDCDEDRLEGNFLFYTYGLNAEGDFRSCRLAEGGGPYPLGEGFFHCEDCNLDDPDEDCDQDGWPNINDNCPAEPNANQLNSDSNPRGDVCDPPNPSQSDADGDGIPDDADNCPQIANLDQADSDGVGPGDACECIDLPEENCEGTTLCEEFSNRCRDIYQGRGTEIVCLGRPGAQPQCTERFVEEECLNPVNPQQSCRAQLQGLKSYSVCPDGVAEGDECPIGACGNDSGKSCANGCEAGERCVDHCCVSQCGNRECEPELGERSITCPEDCGSGCTEPGLSGELIPSCYCGDRIVQKYPPPNLVEEECDDGNTLSGDGCFDCRFEGPICSDGNRENNDGINSLCQPEFCGDGVLQPFPRPGESAENCDDKNNENGDGCAADCQLEFCGDGIRQVFLQEECDDGNVRDRDGCDRNCTVEGHFMRPLTQGEVFYQPLENERSVCFHGCCQPDGLIQALNQIDRDLDGIPLSKDRCPFTINFESSQDEDCDGDLVPDACDNCPNRPNPDQADQDGDAAGDVCDSDRDGDRIEIILGSDRCSEIKEGVTNATRDGDKDGWPDACDNCPSVPNDQANQDGDNFGDACDVCPNQPSNPYYGNRNSDGDRYPDDCDNCYFDTNPRQEDTDSDGYGDVCDFCPTVPGFEGYECSDDDGDGVIWNDDNCPGDFNDDQLNSDSDRFGDACDNCPFHSNPLQWDSDSPFDGVGDNCEDLDRDLYVTVDDNCPTIPNPDQTDTNDDDFGGDDCSAYPAPDIFPCDYFEQFGRICGDFCVDGLCVRPFKGFVFSFFPFFPSPDCFPNNSCLQLSAYGLSCAQAGFAGGCDSNSGCCVPE